MPRFEAFPGLRYDLRAVALDDAIAPPYDIVDEHERARLAARSPLNAIHVELPVEGDGGLDRYTHAAQIFSRWERDGALGREKVNALYVYRMSFRTESGELRSTTGIIGALALDVSGGSEVLPHERTMPKPKGDRLDLLRACQANLSPIWGLSLAPGLAAACLAATGSAPAPMHATDDEGILHELWPITDSGAIDTITSLVASTPVVIADGHHRYETAIFYQEEQRAIHDDSPGEHDFVMALVVELSADQLFVQSIHRLISGLHEDLDLEALLATYFTILEGPSDLGALSTAMTTSGALGLVLADKNLLLVPLPTVDQAAEAELDSSRLDVALASLPAHELVYQHGTQIVADTVHSGRAQAGFLLRPATVNQIADTAHSGRRMPPKTTFFHPKPRTGMVYRGVNR